MAEGTILMPTACSVCFQKFNTPRILPCSHTFCQTCLDKHIKYSQEKTKGLGFSCPLCRDFITAPGVLGQHAPEKWSEHFPINKFVASLIEKNDDSISAGILCEVCKTDGKEETATTWCKNCESTFCETCFLIHKKFNPLQKHDFVSLQNPSTPVEPVEFFPEHCKTHPKCKVDLFCRDHQVSSCALCIPALHQTCKHIGSIEEEAATKSDLIKIRSKGLLKQIKEECAHLEQIVKDGQSNVEEIDDKADLASAMVRNSCKRCVKHLKETEEKQLNLIAKLSKDSKLKLETSIEEFENRKTYLRKCQKTIEDALENGDDVQTLIWYSLMTENVNELKKKELKTIRMEWTSIPNKKKIAEIETFDKFVGLNVNEKVSKKPESVNTVPNHLQLHKQNEWEYKESDIRGGVFLPDGCLVLADFLSKRCAVFSDKGVLKREVKFTHSPWGIHYDQNMKVLYVTFKDKMEIKMINLDDLSEIKVFLINSPVTGITNINGKFLVIGQSQLSMLNSDFELLERTDVDGDSDDITTDLHGNTIYSCYDKDTVTKKDRKNKIQFVYQHPNLSGPNGSAVDPNGNIYVCGLVNDNIHVISGDGKLLKILDGFPSPQFIAFQGNSFRFFVVQNKSCVKICELK